MTTARTGRHAVFGVGIGESALDDQAQDPALHRAIHEELLEDLTVHGQLVFTSEAELARFVAAIRTLPSHLAKVWETVLSSRRVTVRIAEPESSPDLSEVLDPAELERRLAPDVELVLLDADQAELLGVPRDEFSSRTPGGLVEIGRLTTATRTATIMTAQQVMMEPMREDGNREDEWQDRLGPLVAAASPIVIYDKYVGMQCARRYVYGQQYGDGLTWLAGRISMHPGRRMRIITAVPIPRPGQDRIDERTIAVAMLLMKDHIGRELGLDLVLVPERQRNATDRAVERFGHDRHIRFGDRVVLALGLGVQSFEHPRFSETITVARLPVADAKDREERAVKSAVRTPPQGWLAWARSLESPQ